MWAWTIQSAADTLAQYWSLTCDRVFNTQHATQVNMRLPSTRPPSGSWRVEVLVVGLVPDTAPLPADPREGAYDHVVRHDGPAWGIGVRGAVDIDEPAAGGGQDAVSSYVGVLDRVDVDCRAVGMVGEGALVRYPAAVVRGGVVGGHRAIVVATVRVDQLHASDREAGLVELSEDADETTGVSMVHDHLSGVRPAIEAHVAYGQQPQVGEPHRTSSRGVAAAGHPPSDGARNGLDGRGIGERPVWR